MKSQLSKLIMITLAVILMTVGCSLVSKQSAPAPLATATPVTFPIGTFTKANWTIEFFKDGTSHVFQQFVDDVGTYVVNGDQVEFSGRDFCKGITGTYKWAYDGKVLSFTVVEDKCTDRLNQMQQSKWQHQQ